MKTIGENIVITEKIINHKHEVNLQELQWKIVFVSAKRIVVEDTCERQAIILHTITTVQDTSLIMVSDVKYIRRNVYNARRNLQPFYYII